MVSIALSGAAFSHADSGRVSLSSSRCGDMGGGDGFLVNSLGMSAELPVMRSRRRLTSKSGSSPQEKNAVGFLSR